MDPAGIFFLLAPIAAALVGAVAKLPSSLPAHRGFHTFLMACLTLTIGAPVRLGASLPLTIVGQPFNTIQFLAVLIIVSLICLIIYFLLLTPPLTKLAIGQYSTWVASVEQANDAVSLPALSPFVQSRLRATFLWASSLCVISYAMLFLALVGPRVFKP